MFDVTAVYKNTDRTEGKGPMVLDRLFTSHSDAVEYVETQKGIYDVPVKTERGYSGWELRTTSVAESLDDVPDVLVAVERNRQIAAARAKLSPEERELLGLTP